MFYQVLSLNAIICFLFCVYKFMVQTILNNFIFKSYSMEWQDYVFSGIAVALGYSLIPQIIK